MWATVTVIWLRSKFKAPEATVERATESPEATGADVEGAGKRSANKLLNIDRLEVILKNLKSHK